MVIFVTTLTKHRWTRKRHVCAGKMSAMHWLVWCVTPLQVRVRSLRAKIRMEPNFVPVARLLLLLPPPLCALQTLVLFATTTLEPVLFLLVLLEQAQKWKSASVAQQVATVVLGFNATKQRQHAVFLFVHTNMEYFPSTTTKVVRDVCVPLEETTTREQVVKHAVVVKRLIRIAELNDLDILNVVHLVLLWKCRPSTCVTPAQFKTWIQSMNHSSVRLRKVLTRDLQIRFMQHACVETLRFVQATLVLVVTLLQAHVSWRNVTVWNHRLKTECLVCVDQQHVMKARGHFAWKVKTNVQRNGYWKIVSSPTRGGPVTGVNLVNAEKACVKLRKEEPRLNRKGIVKLPCQHVRTTCFVSTRTLLLEASLHLVHVVPAMPAQLVTKALVCFVRVASVRENQVAEVVAVAVAVAVAAVAAAAVAVAVVAAAAVAVAVPALMGMLIRRTRRAVMVIPLFLPPVPVVLWMLLVMGVTLYVVLGLSTPHETGVMLRAALGQ
jgi:hypothetical protein